MSALDWLPSRMALTALALVAGLALAAVPSAAAGGEGFEALARAIVGHAGDARPIRIGLGDFERRPEGVEDPLAYEIRHQLAQALAAIDGVELIARAELDAHDAAGNTLAVWRPLPGAATAADYLVKGTVLAGEDGYRLLVDVVELATGRLFSETEWISGDAKLAAADRRIANRAASLRTIREVDQFLGSMRQDFQLGVLVGGDGRHAVEVGEYIEYYLRSERDAYVAVICHQHDGASFPLLPNLLAGDIFFAAGEIAPIDRNREFDVVATTPGVDVIQGIACERRESIDRIVESFGGRFDGEAETAFLPPVERGVLFASWRQILDERPGERCASTAIRMVVSEPPTEVPSTVTVWIRGLDGPRRQAMTAALQAAPGVEALDDQAVVDGVWSLEVTGTVPASELEAVISTQLPSPLVLLERSPGGIRFGPPVKDRSAGQLLFLVAAAFALVRWLSG